MVAFNSLLATSCSPWVFDHSASAARKAWMLSVVSSNLSGDNSVSHLTNVLGPMTAFRATHDGGGGSDGLAEPVAAEEELADAGHVATNDLDEEPAATDEELADSGPVATRELDEAPVTTREPKLGFEEPV